MNWFKEIALETYFAATRNARRRDAIMRAAQGKAPIMVLFYHRVADVHPNGWTISTKKFAEQMSWIRDHFDIVSLAEAKSRISEPRNRFPSVAITFDDGYADNCEFAIPLLQQEKIPFTYFVATDHVLNQKPFSHDLEVNCPLKPNTPDQLRAIAKSGGTIGAHTRTHADLGKISSREELVSEIKGSKQDIEAMIGMPVEFFAFPFGQRANMSPLAVEVIQESGFSAYCSAYGGYNFAGENPFHIQRIHGDPETIRLKNWLTLDPRKLASGEKYEPSLEVIVANEEQENVPMAISIDSMMNLPSNSTTELH